MVSKKNWLNPICKIIWAPFTLLFGYYPLITKGALHIFLYSIRLLSKKKHIRIQVINITYLMCLFYYSTTFPGFKILLGSNTCLMPRISSTDFSPRTSFIYPFLA